jgi:N-acetylglucosamine-6-phosphate deacetylase
MLYSGIAAHSGKAIALHVNNGIVKDIRDIEERPGLPYLSRGFLDIQVNGYQGVDYSGENLDKDQIDRIVRTLAAGGTTRHLPTIVTSSAERIVRNLRVIAEAVASDPYLKAAIPGIHVEGPFICDEDGPRGAHDKRFVRDPSIEELDAWQRASGSLVKIITVAPEREGAIRFIEEAVKRKIVVAIGHTAATAEQIARAVEAGAELSTHLGNGSHAVLPRLHNYLWEQMSEDRLRASIISDGFHLPGSVLKVIQRTKGLERLILVSDVAFPGGYEPGVYRWGDVEVEVHPDGHLGLSGTSFLAGAGHLLDRDIAHFARETGVGIGDALRLATSNPASLLGLDEPGTGFRIGEPANIVGFAYDPSGGPLGIVDVNFQGRTYP